MHRLAAGREEEPALGAGRARLQLVRGSWQGKRRCGRAGSGCVLHARGLALLVDAPQRQLAQRPPAREPRFRWLGGGRRAPRASGSPGARAPRSGGGWRGARRPPTCSTAGPYLPLASRRFCGVTPAGTAWEDAAEAAHVTSLCPRAAAGGSRLTWSWRVSTRAEPRHAVSARGSAARPRWSPELAGSAGAAEGRPASLGVQGSGPSPSRCCGVTGRDSRLCISTSRQRTESAPWGPGRRESGASMEAAQVWVQPSQWAVSSARSP